MLAGTDMMAWKWQRIGRAARAAAEERYAAAAVLFLSPYQVPLPPPQLLYWWSHIGKN